VNIIVVGSGPAGVSVAKGLLERNCKVTLLDAGNILESEKQILLHEIQLNNHLADTDSLRYHANAKKKSKLPYGSNFIYKGVEDFFSWNTENCRFQPSFARGGLSNVWGGAIASYSVNELSDWPASCCDLSFYYSQIILWLEKYYTADTSSVLSQQAQYLKNNWEKRQSELEKNGFSFRTAMLAVDFNRCRLCGACQYGCPYELIYHSSIHLAWLKQHPNFTYVNDAIVENFSEHPNTVKLVVKHNKNKQSQQFFSDRLFIACGAGLSSLLYLRSLNKPGKELFLKDSQHFILPCLINKKIKDVIKEPLHTLCQLKISLTQKNISHYPAHLQLYTYMDLYSHEMKSKLKWLYPIAKPLLNAWLERLVIIQGYLDSKESNHLIIQYQTSGKFVIKTNNTMPVTSIIHNIVGYLKKHHDNLALKPLRFLLWQSLTGQSNHIGSSLPMSDNPKEDEVDIWGRPCHFKRIHFVDGSILPSIPAGPITLTIMANAYRIGKEGPL